MSAEQKPHKRPDDSWCPTCDEYQNDAYWDLVEQYNTALTLQIEARAQAIELKEQLEAARTDLAEGWTIIWLEDAPYVGDGDRKLDAWAERMQAKYGFDDDSFPASEPEASERGRNPAVDPRDVLKPESGKPRSETSDPANVPLAEGTSSDLGSGSASTGRSTGSSPAGASSPAMRPDA